MYEYIFWLLIFTVLPLIILWGFRYNYLKKYKISFGLAIIVALALSIPWDIISVRERIWYFTEPQIVGIWLLGLPIEEWIFVIVVTLFVATLTVLLWERYGVKK